MRPSVFLLYFIVLCDIVFFRWEMHYGKKIKDKEKALKTAKDVIKKYAISKFREGDKQVSISGDKYEWNVSKSISTGIDKEALANDGLLEKYQTTSETYKLQPKLIKEDK